MTTYDYNTGKALAPGQAQSVYNIQTGQKIGTNTYSPAATSAQANTAPIQSGPVPTVKAPSPAKVYPVITAQAAQKDYQDKLDTYKSLVAQISQQKTLVAQQAAQKAADDAKAQADAAQQKLQQQQIGIQQQQADTQKTEADTKAKALAGINADTSTHNISQAPQTSQAPQPPQANLESAPQDTSYQDIQSAISGKFGSLSDIQDQRDQLTQSSLSALDSLMKGTIPLSSSQQTLISSLQQQLVQNENDQKQANASYTGAVTEAAMRSGGEYTPEQTAGSIHAAISLGVQKIQNLDNSAAQTIAQLEQGFQKDNFDIINQQYSILSKQLDDKASAVSNLYDTVISNIKDQRDFQAAQAKTSFDESMQSANLTLAQKKQAFDQAMQSKQFNEQVRKDNADLYNQAVSRALTEFEDGIPSGSTYDQKSGTFVTPDGQPVEFNPQNVPGFTTLPNGSGVTDLANVPDKMQAGVQAAAQKSGMVVIPKENSAAVTSLNSIQQTFTKAQQDFQAYKSGNKDAYNSYVNDYNQIQAQIKADPKLGGLSGVSLPNPNGFLARTGTALFGTRPQDSGKFNDFQTALNSTYSNLIPNYQAPQFGQTFKSASELQSWAQQNNQTQTLLSLHNKGYSDDQIIQIINGN